ncbi:MULTISPECIES: methyltransferase [unclassified Nocardiopsis]|uniref:methyltransferase n=1 Tax=Nocardiopsis TaxID=2013 RepID=UPI00387B38C3
MSDTASPGLTIADLHGLARGFVKTALLRTAFELVLFDRIAEGENSAEEIARGVGADTRGVRVLCDGLAAIGVLRTVPGGYALPEGGERYLVSSGPEYFGHAMRLSSSDWEWDAQKDLISAVRKGGTVADTHVMTPDFEYWHEFAEHTSWFNGGAADLMADRLQEWAQERESLEILDVACSHGAYGLGMARRHPRARVRAVDWPSVLEITERHAEQLGLRDRWSPLPGDMFDIDFGGPYDLVMLTNVLHHFDEETATTLLRRVAGALKPGGRIALVGHTYEDGQTPEENPLPFMFSVIMLVQSDHGETHSVGTYKRMIENAGLVDPQTYAGAKAMHRLFVADRPLN